VAPPSDDPFASMPRIRPFTDFELDPVDQPAVGWTPPSNPVEPAVDSTLRGRHATPSTPAVPDAGGRRRRADDSENDVLAKILERENRS
jgi:hypothetical protein